MLVTLLGVLAARQSIVEAEQQDTTGSVCKLKVSSVERDETTLERRWNTSMAGRKLI